MGQKHYPYKYKNNCCNREVMCIVCGQVLIENQWVVQRPYQTGHLHLNAEYEGHVMHTDHAVDARGYKLYPKTMRNGLQP